jgi:hypothetical protein
MQVLVFSLEELRILKLDMLNHEGAERDTYTLRTALSVKECRKLPSTFVLILREGVCFRPVSHTLDIQ